MALSSSRLSWTNVEAQAALRRFDGVVRATARRLAPVARAGQALDEEDLCAEGRIAVLEALRTYAGFGIDENVWVRTRIRQRMIDAIRRLDVRSRDEVRFAVRHAGGHSVGTAENDRGRLLAARRLVSYDSAAPEQEPLAARLSDTHVRPADEVAEHNAQHVRLLGALADLPPRQRIAIELGLFEGLPLREIGDRMGISESRACQLQKRAVQQLQKVIQTSVALDAA